jgi:hypothetical protein
MDVRWSRALCIGVLRFIEESFGWLRMQRSTITTLCRHLIKLDCVNCVLCICDGFDIFSKRSDAFLLPPLYLRFSSLTRHTNVCLSLSLSFAGQKESEGEGER